MSKSGSGGRTDWKDKIDQSSWVDNTAWAGSEKDDAEPGVEFLETEPSAFRLNEPTEAVSESLLSSSTSRILALGAVGVVLVALAIMSRPGDQNAFDQLPTSDQQQILERRGLADDPAEDGSADEVGGSGTENVDGTGSDGAGSEADSGSASTDAASSTPPPPPIAGLRSDLPETLTGTLHITGSDGSLVSVHWAEATIDELPLPDPDNAGTTAVHAMQLSGQDLILAGDQTLFQLTGNGLQATSADLIELLPTDTGLTVVAPTNDGGREIFLVPPPGGPESVDTVALRDVPGDVVLIGRWNQRLLATKAGKVWLLDTDGTTGSAITDGQLLSFDGRYLVMLRCDGQLLCRLEAGPPDQPDRVVLPVPEQLTGRDPTGWGASVTVAADGQRLALVDDIGAFSTTLSIDLDTGVVTEGTDIVNGDSPLAWSPDGQVLAYAFGDDLVLWDRSTDQRYRIDIDREIDLLLWAADPPVDG